MFTIEHVKAPFGEVCGVLYFLARELFLVNIIMIVPWMITHLLIIIKASFEPIEQVQRHTRLDSYNPSQKTTH